jgi:hypothetical protein
VRIVESQPNELVPATSGPAKLGDRPGPLAIGRQPAATPTERCYSSAVPESDCGRSSSGSLAIFAAILRVFSSVTGWPLSRGLGRQKPNYHSQREHDDPRNQMTSDIRVGLDYMLYQKRHAAKRY